MARNDGIDRTMARNRDLIANDIKNAQAHNEREKEMYSKDKVEAAVESVKQEEARVQAEKQRKRQYTR